MNPQRHILVIPALLSSLVSLGVAQLAGFALVSRPDLRWEIPSQGMLTLVALIPAFITSYIAASQEHEAVSFALGFRRLLLAAGAIVSILFSAVLVFGMADDEGGYYVQTMTFVQILTQGTLFTFFLFEVLRIEAWRRDFGGILSSYNALVGMLALFLSIVFVLLLRFNGHLVDGVTLYCDYVLCLLAIAFPFSLEDAIVPNNRPYRKPRWIVQSIEALIADRLG